MLGNTAFAATPFADMQQGAFLSSGITESAGYLDSQDNQIDYVANVTDTVTATDSATKTLTIPVSVSEVAVASASQTAVFVANTQVNEAFVGTATPASQANYVATQEETLQAFDFQAGALDMPMVVTDSTTVSDENSRRLLWEKIEDGQSVTWVKVNTPTSTWDTVDDSQSPSWKNIE